MIRVGIIGAAGYTAGELIRILVNHPDVEIIFAHSQSNSGKRVTDIHEGLLGDTQLLFSSEIDLEAIDILFMCKVHGQSRKFWEEHTKPANLKVIDMAQDFRDESCGYVYGLPEWQTERIASASKVANPGCFATAIQLSLLPLSGAGLLLSEVNVTAITGSTGAGVKPSATTHFSWRTDNISAYKVMEHQHLLEIKRNLGKISRMEKEPQINFIPLRGDFSRGIFATLSLDCTMEEDGIVQIYKLFYKDAPFCFVADEEVNLKQVLNTNKCVMHLGKHKEKLVINTVIDNLLKGASGQAVQNMNIMFGLPQKEGLRLKASAF